MDEHNVRKPLPSFPSPTHLVLQIPEVWAQLLTIRTFPPDVEEFDGPPNTNKDDRKPYKDDVRYVLSNHKDGNGEWRMTGGLESGQNNYWFTYLVCWRPNRESKWFIAAGEEPSHSLPEKQTFNFKWGSLTIKRGSA